jgi:hypothetical protein
MIGNGATKEIATERRRRWGLAQGSRVVDPYKNPGRLRTPSVCSQCNAIFYAGRWHWGPRPPAAHEIVCQACHRSNDGIPAGVITLHGTFVRPNRAELIAAVREQGESERRDRPLNRIIAIEPGDDRIVVNTTDVQLPVRIGEAMRRNFQGTLKRDFDQENYVIRVDWQRDA